MKKIEKYNYDLIKRDIDNIYVIFKDIMVERDSSVLMLGWFQYFILICIESLNYTKINKNVKYKKILKRCRARIKPFEMEYSKIYENMQELNSKKMNEYTEYVKKGFRTILSKYITNYGIYKINNKIIGNTFLYESVYKDLIYEKGKVCKDKMIEIGKEVGTIICELISLFGLEKAYKGNSRELYINDEDYNVFRNNNKLLKENIDTNNGLILINIISTINFYNYVICTMNIRKELKYRLGYIVYDNTYENILKVIKNIENKELNEKIIKYKCLNNREYRNCMFHYNLEQDLREEEIKNEMYFGIIYKYLGINESEYIKLIDEYMYEIAEILEKNILI